MASILSPPTSFKRPWRRSSTLIPNASYSNWFNERRIVIFRAVHPLAKRPHLHLVGRIWLGAVPSDRRPRSHPAISRDALEPAEPVRRIDRPGVGAPARVSGGTAFSGKRLGYESRPRRPRQSPNATEHYPQSQRDKSDWKLAGR
jgi:hypothetical protein